MKDERISKLREKAVNLPLTPGVYIMRDTEGNVIYVGKAKSLKKRVSGYFLRVGKHDRKTEAMVASVDRFDVMKTRTELEALLLECNLIKQHMPLYNILLKDDKGICYIVLTGGEYPILNVSNRKPSGGVFFGPFYTRGLAKSLADSAGRAFLLPECGRVTRQDRPCLCYHIGRCSGPCANRISREEYAAAIDGACRFLKGDTDGVTALLTSKMEEAAERLDFEKAAFYRDRLASVAKIRENQSIIFKTAKNADGIAVVRSEKNLAVSVLPIRKGLMLTAALAVPEAAGSDEGLVFDYLTGYYSQAEIPQRIYLSEPLAGIELFRAFLKEKAGRDVPVSVPREGSDGARIISYSAEDAREFLVGHEKSWGLSDRAGEELMRLTGLKSVPHRIEMFDISHTAGSETVAGMTVFEDFRPVKQDYRRFALRTAADKDDTAATAEVLGRRLDDYLAGKEGFTVLPDLFIADGGGPQRRVIAAALEERGIDRPAVALKKDSHHRTKSLITEVNEIKLQEHRELWTVLTRLQDEVHRFALSYHKNRRSQTVKGLSLTAVEGLGPKKARLVLAHFRTMTALRAASREEITSVPGLDRKTASRLADAVEKGEI